MVLKKEKKPKQILSCNDTPKCFEMRCAHAVIRAAGTGELVGEMSFIPPGSTWFTRTRMKYLNAWNPTDVDIVYLEMPSICINVICIICHMHKSNISACFVIFNPWFFCRASTKRCICSSVSGGTKDVSVVLLNSAEPSHGAEARLLLGGTLFPKLASHYSPWGAFKAFKAQSWVNLRQLTQHRRVGRREAWASVLFKCSPGYSNILSHT